MIDIFVGFLFLVALGLLEHFFGPMGALKKAPPCTHGIIGDCKSCRAETEQYIRREGYKQDWEKLRRAEIKRLSQERLRASEAYFAMEPRQFEDAVMRVFRKLGYRVNQTAYVGDGGKDAIARKDKRKYVIECKRYGSRSKTGRRDLQILLAAKHDVEADGAIFVTTGRLSAPAIAYARENDIQYFDKDSFPDLINRAYGESEEISTVWTCCLECGAHATVPLAKEGDSWGWCSAVIDENAKRLEIAYRAGTEPIQICHTLRSTVNHSQLKYHDLDLDAPWCNDHQVPMRRVSGYRGEFWGCPEYPQCRNTEGYTSRLPEIIEEESKARRAELMQVYNDMSETLRERWRRKVDSELSVLAQSGVRSNRTPEDIAAVIAARYIQGR